LISKNKLFLSALTTVFIASCTYYTPPQPADETTTNGGSTGNNQGAIAKEPRIVWKRYYGGEGRQIGKDIIRDKDNIYSILAIGPSKILFYKIDGEGSELLSKTVAKKTVWGLYDMAKVGKNYVIAGSETKNVGSQKNGFIEYTTNNGSLIWEKVFDKFKESSVKGVAPVDYKSFIGVGTADKGKVWIFKMDNRKKIDWEMFSTISGSPEDIIKTNDGDYITVGYTFNPESNVDGFIIKVSKGGNLVYQKTIGSKANERLHGITQAYGGGYMAVGYKDKLIWLVRLNESGDKVWEKTIEFKNNIESIGVDIIKSFDGNYIIIGATNLAKDKYDLESKSFITKVDMQGNVIWNLFVDDTLERIIRGNYMEYYAVGHNYIKNRDFDISVIKIKEE
jgi:hypothetical protein